MATQGPKSQSVWTRRCGPLKAFAVAALLGALVGAMVGLFVDHRDLRMIAGHTLISSALFGLCGSATSFAKSYPTEFEVSLRIYGAVLIVSLIVAMQFEFFAEVVNRGLLWVLVFFGVWNGIAYFIVVGIAGIVVGTVDLMKGNRNPRPDNDSTLTA